MILLWWRASSGSGEAGAFFFFPFFSFVIFSLILIFLSSFFLFFSSLPCSLFASSFSFSLLYIHKSCSFTAICEASSVFLCTSSFISSIIRSCNLSLALSCTVSLHPTAFYNVFLVFCSAFVVPDSCPDIFFPSRLSLPAAHLIWSS